MRWGQPIYHLAGNLKEVLSNKSERANYTFRILPNGESFYEKNGIKISAEDFENKYPLKIIKAKKATPNPDKRHNWVNDEVSY